MASRSTSIFVSFLSGGKVGSRLLSEANATLNRLTLNLSRDACAQRYFGVARRRRRRSSRDILGMTSLAPVVLGDLMAASNGVFEFLTSLAISVDAKTSCWQLKSVSLSWLQCWGSFLDIGSFIESIVCYKQWNVKCNVQQKIYYNIYIYISPLKLQLGHRKLY